MQRAKATKSSWFLIAITAAATGCASPGLGPPPRVERQLALASAGLTGCDPDKIQIAKLKSEGHFGAWTSSCHGKVFQCSALPSDFGVPAPFETITRLDAVSCTLRNGASEQPAGVVATDTAPPETGVSRERIDKGIGFLLRARIVEGVFLMDFSVVFAEGNDSVTWLTTPSRTKGYEVDERCAVVLLIDGERVPLARAPASSDPQLIKLKVPLALVKRMAEAKRVVGRICDQEWRLSPSSQEVLQEFLVRLNEEQLLSKPSAP